MSDGRWRHGGTRTPGWATLREQGRNRRHHRRLTVNGETRLLVEWEERTGVDRETIINRMRRGWSPERCIAPVTNETRRRRIVNGVPVTMLARQLGVPSSTLFNRLNRGAPAVPDGGRRLFLQRMITAYDVRHSLSEWAASTGILRETIAGRLNRGWRAEAALGDPLDYDRHYDHDHKEVA